MSKAQGRPVYANYHIAGINCPRILRGARPAEYVRQFGGFNDNDVYGRVTDEYYNTYGKYYIPDPEILISMTRGNRFERNSLVVLDEAYAWGLDARETMSGEKDSRKARLALTHAILQSRKAHFNIEHTEQLIKSIDNRLRFLTEIYVLMEGISYRYIDGEKMNTEFKLSPFQNLGVWGFKQLPPLFIKEPIFWLLNRYYDTYEQVTLQEEAIEKIEGNTIKKERIESAPKVQKSTVQDNGDTFVFNDKRQADAEAFRKALGPIADPLADMDREETET